MDTNVIVHTGDVSIIKDDNVTTVSAGDANGYTFTIRATNNGISDARNVWVSDTWPIQYSQG